MGERVAPGGGVVDTIYIKSKKTSEIISYVKRRSDEWRNTITLARLCTGRLHILFDKVKGSR